MSDEADRAAVLAERLAAHGLESASTDLESLSSALCGYRDDRSDTGIASLVMRIGWPNTRRARNADDLVTVMGARGAPHLHRRDDLGLVRAAMTLQDRDLPEMMGDRARVVAQVTDPVGHVAAAMAEVVGDVGEPISKSALSEGITPDLAPALVVTCERCGTDHVEDGLFRLATLRAGLELVGTGRGQSFAPTGAVDATPPSPDQVRAARRRFVDAATAMSIHTSPDAIAAWFGWHRASVQEARAGEGGSEVATSRSRTTRTVRLLPARDPWLAGSDRAWLLGANVARRSEVFRSLGAPGVVVRRGEIVGTWRQRVASSKLAIAVDVWDALTGDERGQVLADADTVAACRDRRAAVSGLGG